MCCDTHDGPSERSFLHVPEQPRLVILLKTTNDPFQSQIFYTSKSCEQLKLRSKRRFKHLKNSNDCKIQMFVFKIVEERCRCHNKRKKNFHLR